MKRDIAVAKYMEYAKERARWWISKHPSMADDMMATAMLQLIRACNVQPTYYKGCISKYIDNAMADLINDNDLIHIPKITRQRLIKAKESLEHLPKAHLVDERIQARARQHPTWVKMHVDDVMELLKLSAYERHILGLRMDGHTLKEIGRAVGRTKQTVDHTLQQISQRYTRLRNSHTELL